MEDTSVVTCFLRNRGDVLLFRRSEAVGSYAGMWGAIAGHVEDEAEAEANPDTAARMEIAEEAGLEDAVTLVRRGEPFSVEDPDLDTRWIVHPYLFDCESRTVTTNDETTAYEWVSPTEIRRRKTVPDLWTSYDRVRPTVETITEDSEHGSAYLSIRALEILRDQAALLAEQTTAERDSGSDTDTDTDTNNDNDWYDLAALAADLRAAQPSMTVVANRINRVMATARERTPSAAAVESAANDCIETARAADVAAAEAAGKHVAGDHIVTLSRSGTVRETLALADPASVLVAESRPGGEGVDVAESLTAEGLDVTLAPDAALGHLLTTGEYDTILVGADTILPDGSVLNKVGTRQLALAGARENVPVYVVTARDKISPDETPHFEDGTPADLYDGDDDGAVNTSVSVAVPLFDVTPADLVSGVYTENGLLDTADVREIAAQHRTQADWQ